MPFVNILTGAFNGSDFCAPGERPATEDEINAQHDAVAWKQFALGAQLALDQSDRTVLRCVEAGIALPSAWVDYRKTLRAIISGTPAAEAVSLPTCPAYPEST